MQGVTRFYFKPLTLVLTTGKSSFERFFKLVCVCVCANVCVMARQALVGEESTTFFCAQQKVCRCKSNFTPSVRLQIIFVGVGPLKLVWEWFSHTSDVIWRTQQHFHSIYFVNVALHE